MNGPNPVWMSATKNVNQSSPRRLAREGLVERQSAFELGSLRNTGPPPRGLSGGGGGSGLGGLRRCRAARGRVVLGRLLGRFRGRRGALGVTAVGPCGWGSDGQRQHGRRDRNTHPGTIAHAPFRARRGTAAISH